MYADLPHQLQQLVKGHLLANDFRTAKQIHDNWMAEQHHMDACPVEWKRCAEA